MPGPRCDPWSRRKTLTGTRGGVMEVPIVAPAAVVSDRAAVCRDLFAHQGQCRHCQHDPTGLLMRPCKGLAHITRGILDSADHTHRSRVLSEASWQEDAVNRRRIRFMRQQTAPHRRRRRDSVVVLDESPVRTGGKPQ